MDEVFAGWKAVSPSSAKRLFRHLAVCAVAKVKRVVTFKIKIMLYEMLFDPADGSVFCTAMNIVERI